MKIIHSAIVLVLAIGSGQARAERLQIADFEYLGAFKMPQEDGFLYGSAGASYLPDGNGGAGSLLVTGHPWNTCEWGEVSIPDPVEGNLGEMNRAQMLMTFREFDGNLIEQEVSPSEVGAGGLECIPPRGSQTSMKCYWNPDWWYNVGGEDYRAVGMSELDGSNPQGMWHVGPTGDGVFHGSRHADYMFSIPADFAGAHLGGRDMMIGGTRNAGAFGASQGPTLFAFQVWDTDSPPDVADLDAQALVYYPEIYPECSQPTDDDCHYPGYSACDNWVGGAFVRAGTHQAVILIGDKGLGDTGYGQGDPGDCTEGQQGYHCDPYAPQVIFYDIEDLQAAAAGNVDPWTVVPYETWHFPWAQNPYCDGGIGTLTYDAQGGRIFVIEHLYAHNETVVHVLQVEASPPQDGGVDAGTDAGNGDDAGTTGDDAGTATDAGADSGQQDEADGCSCGSRPSRAASLVIILFVVGSLSRKTTKRSFSRERQGPSASVN